MNNTEKAISIPDGGRTTAGVKIPYISGTTTIGATYISGTTVHGLSKGQTTTKYPAKNIENAVYSHIQAIRALGRTRTDTSEIARALGLTQSVVEKTISSLTKKGVRVIGG